MIKKSISLTLAVATLLCAISSAAGVVHAKDGVKFGTCMAPYAEFKYSYMDAMLRETPRPSDNQFLSLIHGDVSIPEMQFLLWYVHRNPDLANAFFNKVSMHKLVERNVDAINSIIWIIVEKDLASDSKFKKHNSEALSKLKKWRAELRVDNPYESLRLDLYAGEVVKLKEFSKKRLIGHEEDVDVLIKMAIMSEHSHKYVEALFYYSQAASYGYQGSLVGAALLLPRVGGSACKNAAVYYVNLAGVLHPREWWKGSNH